MKFSLHDQSCKTESDSDWDTAIELITYTTERTNLLIKAEGGAIISISKELKSRSGQYLEPDFDNEYETGKVGPYVFHKDSRASSSSVKYFGGHVIAPLEIKPIQVAEFKAVMKAQAEGEDVYEACPRFAGKVIDYMNRSPEGVTLKALDIDEDSPPKYGQFDFVNPGIDAEMVKQIFKAMPEDFGQRGGAKEFEIDLSTELEEKIRLLGALHQKTADKAPQMIIDNMAREANAKIGLMIDSMVAQNKRELRLSHACAYCV